MTEFLEWVMAGFEPTVFFTLLASSFVGSFVTVALGIGGGVLLLAMMASLMPPVALIPVHGVIQVGSNVLRAAIMHKHVFWPPFAAFAFGTAVDVAVGGDRHSHRVEAHAARVLGWIDAQRDLTLVEIADRLAGEGHVFAPVTIWRLLDRHNYTVKKRPLMPANRSVTM